MEVFRTHPSVRVKGTEDNYEPIACNISTCVKRNVHLHCPFCVKTESFYDPVILKAHYRVKHVDKGIEFAGLKILRCCDHCMIVGSIKGSKEFKGAHWHCYNCRNGFNRRDEALKHYKTHFRNPMTTFQIQITHDINQMMELSQVNMMEVGNMNHTQEHTLDGQQTLSTTIGEDGTIVTGTQAMPWIVSTETVVSSASNQQEPEVEGIHDGSLMLAHDEASVNNTVTTQNIQVCPETVEESQETQYYIIGEDGQLTVADTNEITAAAASSASDEVVVGQDNEVNSSDWQTQRQQLLAKLAEMDQKYETAMAEKKQSDDYFNAKIIKLKVEVQLKEGKIIELQERERELLAELKSEKAETHVNNILNEMKCKQEELMNQYMSKLKETVGASSKDKYESQSNENNDNNTEQKLDEPVEERNDSNALQTVRIKSENVSDCSSSVNSDVLTADPHLIDSTGIINVKKEIASCVNKQYLNTGNLQKSTSPRTKTIVLKTIPKAPVSNSAKVSLSNIAKNLPLSKYIFSSNNSSGAHNNVNLITTESGSQYMVFVNPSPSAPVNEISADNINSQQVLLRNNISQESPVPFEMENTIAEEISTGTVNFQENCVDGIPGQEIMLPGNTSQGNATMQGNDIDTNDMVCNLPAKGLDLQEVTMEAVVEEIHSDNQQFYQEAIDQETNFNANTHQAELVTESIDSTISDQVITRSDDFTTGGAEITGSDDIAKNVNYVTIEHGYVSTDISSTEQTVHVSSTQNCENTEGIDDGNFCDMTIPCGNDSGGDNVQSENVVPHLDNSSLNISYVSEVNNETDNNTLKGVKRKVSVTPESSPINSRPKRQRKAIIRD